MLRAVMAQPDAGPITRRAEYDAHPVGKPPIHYNNTNHPAARGNVQVLGGKTGYNDEARYCLVVATKIDGRTYYMAFLGDDGKMTRFGDVARVADWIVSHPQKLPPPLPAPLAAAAGASRSWPPPPPSAPCRARCRSGWPRPTPSLLAGRRSRWPPHPSSTAPQADGARGARHRGDALTKR